jgi:hypothetical protein
MLSWIPGHTRGEAAAAALDLLRRAGIRVRHELSQGTPAQIRDESDRLIQQDSEVVPVYVVGPDARDLRLDLTVASGSFARASQHGTNVFAELAPRVPVTIVEGDRPVAL